MLRAPSQQFSIADVMPLLLLCSSIGERKAEETFKHKQTTGSMRQERETGDLKLEAEKTGHSRMMNSRRGKEAAHQQNFHLKWAKSIQQVLADLRDEGAHLFPQFVHLERRIVRLRCVCLLVGH